MKLEKIFKEALENKASDIYITTGAKPVFRIHGELVVRDAYPVLDENMAEEYLMEIATEDQKEEFKKNLDIDFAINVPEIARFRVNIFSQRRGIGGVFRLIPSKIPTMEELRLPEAFKKIPNFPNGLVLVTGPTGSGKSTTLAAVIGDINANMGAHIITIEDPIEFVYENKKSVVEQREVNTNTKSFQNALRAALREDPDVILVGELRDLDTISLAITAAETGHLVFGTLHTSGAAKTIDRIINVFPGERQNQIRSELAAVLRIVVWQQLIPRKDGSGRIGVYEILSVNPAVSNLIRGNKIHEIPSVIETGAREGMQSMEQCVIALLKEDIISQEDALKAIPHELSPGELQKRMGK